MAVSQLTKRALAESLKALLAQKPLSKITISDITAHCGFTSFSQFNRVFRKFCGESPSDYRKSRFPSTEADASGLEARQTPADGQDPVSAKLQS